MAQNPIRLVILLADAGIPMIAVSMQIMVAALLPVFFIEALVISRRIGIAFKPALSAAVPANLLSTLVGIPITWLALFACELLIGSSMAGLAESNHNWESSPILKIITVIINSPWLGPADPGDKWMVPLAALVLLVPFYFVSVLVERWVARHILLNPNEEPEDYERRQSSLDVAVRDANLWSYGGLFLVTSIWLLRSR